MLKSYTPIPLQLATEFTLSGWYDASESSSIISSGGAVSEWRDISGNKRNLSQAAAGNKPTTGTQTIRGKNVIAFDATSSDYMDLSSTVFANLSTGSATVFIVGSITDAAPAASMHFLGTSVSQRFYILGAATTAILQATLGPGAAIALASTVAATVNPVIAMTSYNGSGATDTGYFSVNNETPVTNTIAFTGRPDTVKLGARSATANFMTGNIAEVLFFQSILTTSAMNTMWKYLSEKWGVTIA